VDKILPAIRQTLALAKECDLVGMGIQTNLQLILEFNGVHKRPQIMIAIGESIQYFEDQVDLCRRLKGSTAVALDLARSSDPFR